MSPSRLNTFILPDLFSHCTYPLRVNVACKDAARASEQWLLGTIGRAKLDPSERDTFFGLMAGELVASALPDAHPFRLRISCDIVNYLFNLSHWSHEFNPGDLAALPNCVLSAFEDPYGFETDKVAGILAKEYFSPISMLPSCLSPSSASTLCSAPPQDLPAQNVSFTPWNCFSQRLKKKPL